MESKHLCRTCRHDFATCRPMNIVFGIDVDSKSAHTNESDRVVSCDLYSPTPIDRYTAALRGEVE